MASKVQNLGSNSTRKNFLDAISNALLAENHLMVTILQSTYFKSEIGENDKKELCDQAFRIKLLNLPLEFSIPTFEKLIQLSFDSVVSQMCSPTLPVVLLTDTFEMLPIETCEEIFYIVEMKVAVWKQELFFKKCKSKLLRLCNDLLRRLSRSQNTVFCGRILLFLAKFFPFAERSGLNVSSEFNVDNLTAFKGIDENSLDVPSGDENQEIMEVDDSFQADGSLYKTFWSLQDFFRNPNQCYRRIQWASFCSHTNEVLSAFSNMKLEERMNCSNPEEGGMDVAEPDGNAVSVQKFFAKYLTSPSLLELQLGDSKFRQYILNQFLIIFQYLNAHVRFKQDSQKLSDEQKNWVINATEQVYKLLEDTPPNGKAFAQAIRHILKREELWNNWKNEGCKDFKLSMSSQTVEASQNGALSAVIGRSRSRGKKPLGEIIRDSVEKNKRIIGNPALNRLWNAQPDNLDACRAKERDFLPSLENYFEEAIEQLDPSVESQYKRVNEGDFGWRALRLLSRRSSLFFTHSSKTITEIPEYLEMHVRKLAASIQETSTVFVNVQSEPSNLDTGFVEPMESDPVATNELQGGSGMDDENFMVNNRSVPCTPEQLNLLSQRLALQWRILAPKLGFGPDEVDSFVSQLEEDAAAKMFERWMVNEKDAATPEILIHALEGLGLLSLVQGIF